MSTSITEDFHEHLICDHELELFGLFLTNRSKYLKYSQADEPIVLNADYTAPIERAYREGLCFENESYLEQTCKKKDWISI